MLGVVRETFKVYGMVFIFLLPLAAGVAVFMCGLWISYNAPIPKIVASPEFLTVRSKGKYKQVEYPDVTDISVDIKTDKKGRETKGFVHIATKDDVYKYKTCDMDALKRFQEKSEAVMSKFRLTAADCK
jgi:hypothetical protein